MAVERFAPPELAALRTELMQGSLDARQAAELFQMFLIGRGYGVSRQAACDAAAAVGGSGCTIEALQRELGRIAMVM